MIICAGEIEQFDFAESVGIGLVDVAINLTRLCIDKQPDSILFIGTAGSYGGVGLMQIVKSQKSCQIEQSFLRDDSYSPIDNFISSIENVSHETLVNSSSYITTNEEISKQYLGRNIEIENMEFYSVLKVAEKFNIPAKGIFVTTNFCNKFAHRDFMKNHKEAIHILTNTIGEMS